jgi:hypothetical protein
LKNEPKILKRLAYANHLWFILSAHGTADLKRKSRLDTFYQQNIQTELNSRFEFATMRGNKIIASYKKKSEEESDSSLSSKKVTL